MNLKNIFNFPSITLQPNNFCSENSSLPCSDVELSFCTRQVKETTWEVDEKIFLALTLEHAKK